MPGLFTAALDPVINATATLSVTYVEPTTCPSTLSINTFTLSSTTLSPGSSYTASASLSVNVAPNVTSTLYYWLILTVGTATATVASGQLVWGIGYSGMNITTSFTCPDLKLPGGSYSGTMTLQASLACGTTPAFASASVPLTYTTAAAIPWYWYLIAGIGVVATAAALYEAHERGLI